MTETASRKKIAAQPENNKSLNLQVVWIFQIYLFFVQELLNDGFSNIIKNPTLDTFITDRQHGPSSLSEGGLFVFYHIYDSFSLFIIHDSSPVIG